MKKIVFPSMILFIILFTGCSTKGSLVLKEGYKFENNPKINVDKITNDTSKVYEHNIEEFMKEALFEELKNNELLVSGNEAKIDLQVSILDYQEGNAFKRWLLPGWGATVLKVEATLKENNDVIATSKIDSNIAAGGGYTIGAWKYVYTGVAKKLISDIKEEYAKK
ncbi:MAG: DUF4410 domain-containing protein [Arcobacter sp.]|jgi:hypothetical protein|uniref:DUF4410 domain-containing protein n=1 Tax=Arcobacter sp. TaxID=1872629 RepID=UPI002A758002|nr:DUF4410 domain-containing protein [Arcobacter sp.]MDY3204024.1 DUF4410 domain-containing protein [Arcobacter sp.]